MPCRIASEYVSKLKTAGHPTVVSGNQIVSGRVVLTVEPSLDQGDAFQVQVPGGFDVKENLCLPLLFSLVFDSAEVWWPLWLRISKSLSGTGSFSDVVKGWSVSGSLLGRDVVLNFCPQHTLNKSMIHYTLNTGKSFESKRGAQAVIDQLRPLTKAGGAIPGRPPFLVELEDGTGGTVFTVCWGEAPLATCGLAWTAEAAGKLWPLLEKQYFHVTDLVKESSVERELVAKVSAEAKEPGSLPWLCVVLFPLRTKGSPPDISWLPEFECAMAWAILAERAVAPA